MKELYCSLSIVFLLILAWIAWQDYKTKLISLCSFYILNIVALVWLYFFGNIYVFFLMLLYFLGIFILDILDYFGKLPKFISTDWMIGETGIYDYWIYLFIISLFISYLPKDFLYYYLSFSLSLALGASLVYFLTKKRYAKHIPLFTYAFVIILFMMISIFIHQ